MKLVKKILTLPMLLVFLSVAAASLAHCGGDDGGTVAQANGNGNDKDDDKNGDGDGDTALQEGALVITEIFRGSDLYDGLIDDYIEIYNNTDAAIDLGGVYITDDTDNPLDPTDKFVIADGVTLQPGAFLVIYPNDDSPVPGTSNTGSGDGSSSFGIGGSDTLFVMTSNGTLLDEVIFDGDSDWSFFEKDGAIEFDPTSAADPAAANDSPGNWAVSTNEIMDGLFGTPGLASGETLTASPQTISVEVTGLTGTGLVLQNMGGDDLTIDNDGTHSFATQSVAYDISIETLPSGEVCSVSGAASGVATSAVTVNISCSQKTPATVIITEVNQLLEDDGDGAVAADICPKMELYVTGTGTMLGITLDEYDGEWKNKYTFVDLDVTAGEYIVVHFQMDKEACNDNTGSSAPAEETSIDDSPGTWSIATAWDVHSEKNLADNDSLVRLYSAAGSLLDTIYTTTNDGGIGGSLVDGGLDPAENPDFICHFINDGNWGNTTSLDCDSTGDEGDVQAQGIANIDNLATGLTGVSIQRKRDNSGNYCVASNAGAFYGTTDGQNATFGADNPTLGGSCP